MNSTLKTTFFISMMSLLSCEGILDKDPIAILDAGSYFQTEADAVQAINAAYNPLLFNNTNNNFYWAMAVITGDEAIPGGDGSRPGIVEMETFTYTPRTQELNDFWKLQYKGITQANLVLDNIDNINMDKTVQNRIKGEALFLRAYYYFQLTQVFGDVPLYLKVTAPDQLKIPRTAKAQIYQQILSDCDAAALLLPATQTTTNVGRATKGAALALATKTSLYSKDYNKTLAYVQQVKGLGVYALVTDYNSLFQKTTQNNSESVWEIQHTNLELGVGNFLNQWWASKKFLGYGFAETTPEFVQSFEANDPRLKFTVARNNEPYFGLIYKNSFSSTFFSPRKFIQSDAELTQKADGDINYPAIRYAEVLLWEAEALVELGRVSEALVPLEAVRARARAQATGMNVLPAIVSTDQNIVRDAIRQERKVELGYELHRFFDLVRWGIASDVLEGFQVGKHEVFPLPQTEIDLNPSLYQNAGY
ncbi:MAG TPA: RagB/SusD family nutrient uptake outer membrane protein [Saprospiraceae bacterium]|nr:RagB/SusD family nutrient uptake outer membrane protein [Saprospiraceae bacterium]